jgi:hypothetical protein
MIQEVVELVELLESPGLMVYLGVEVVVVEAVVFGISFEAS